MSDKIQRRPAVQRAIYAAGATVHVALNKNREGGRWFG